MKSAEELLKDTFFIVEATSFERQCLWAEFASNSFTHSPGLPYLEWQEDKGWWVTVGHLAEMPVCLTLRRCRIEGELVMFWDACSQVVDHRLIDKWLDENFKGTWNKGEWDGGSHRAATNAQNFHHCVHALQEKGKAKNIHPKY